MLGIAEKVRTIFCGRLSMDLPELADQQKVKIYLLCMDTESRLEDLPRVITNRDGRWESFMGIRANSF